MEAVGSRDPFPGNALQEIRQARFGVALLCPRCGGDRIQRWGGFSGRQRYRCKGCGRTFSDLTGTPAAYSKRLPLWAPYATCLRDGISVRRAAQRIGVHPATAFRWRHAILDAMRGGDGESVHGWVELGWTRFAYSDKGSRKPRTELPPEAGSIVVVACDRFGYVVTGATTVTPRARPRAEELEQLLCCRLQARPVITAAEGRLGPISRYAAGVGIRFYDTRRSETCQPPQLAHVRTTREYRYRLKRWIRRFRGVATRYLPNYLVWHRAVDRAIRQDLGRTALLWPVGTWQPSTGRPPEPRPMHQQFSRTLGEAGAEPSPVVGRGAGGGGRVSHRDTRRDPPRPHRLPNGRRAV